MSGVVCLQGGREFTADCNEMDREVLASSGASRIAVLAGAARIGSDHDGATRRALDHYDRLGIDGRGVPDPRVDLDAAIASLVELDPVADLVVLPGGSPSSLLDVLTSGDSRAGDSRAGDRCVGDFLVRHHRAGGAISGASAGAMVLCESMVRPDRGGDIVDGLGLVTGLALPHWTPNSDRAWEVGDLPLWGLPECGGALIGGRHEPIGVGRGAAARRLDGTWIPLPRTRS